MGLERKDDDTVVEQWTVRLELLLHARCAWWPQQQDDKPSDLRHLFLDDQDYKHNVAPRIRRQSRKPKTTSAQQQQQLLQRREPEYTHNALQDNTLTQQQQLAGTSKQHEAQQQHTAGACANKQLSEQLCRRAAEHGDPPWESHGSSTYDRGCLRLQQTGDCNMPDSEQAPIGQPTHAVLHVCGSDKTGDAAAATSDSCSRSSSKDSMASERLEAAEDNSVSSCNSSCSSTLDAASISASSSKADMGMASSSSSIARELYRLQQTKWSQAAGALMLGIAPCMLAVTLVLQHPRAEIGAFNVDYSSSSFAVNNCNALNLVLSALPGLGAALLLQLRPLQFMSAHLESLYQAYALGSKQTIDVLLGSSWCLLALCSALHSTCTQAGAVTHHGASAAQTMLHGPSPSPSPGSSLVLDGLLAVCETLHAGMHQECVLDAVQQSSGNPAAAAAPVAVASADDCYWQMRHVILDPWFLLLIAPMLVLVWLASMGPRTTYSKQRERVLVLCRFFMISSTLGIGATVQSGGPLLFLTTLHALLSVCTMVRFSSFAAMQLMQVVALLIASPGQPVLYSVQLVMLGFIVPCFALLYVEVAARHRFLVCQHSDGVVCSMKSPGSCLTGGCVADEAAGG